MVLYYWDGSNWIEGQPANGQKYKKVFDSGGVEQGYWNEVVTPNVIPLENISITGGTLEGSIWWIQDGTQVGLTGTIALPDGELMTMIERVIDADNPVDDVRTKVSISGGNASMNFTFPQTGNYLLKASRLNEGLDRIGAGFHVGFDDIEFDVYI